MSFYEERHRTPTFVFDQHAETPYTIENAHHVVQKQSPRNTHLAVKGINKSFFVNLDTNYELTSIL